MKGKTTCISARCVTGFAGDISNHYFFTLNKGKGIWIINMGATLDPCHDFSLLINLTKLENKLFITLPDDYTQLVTHTGSVKMTLKLQLLNVLYIPNFKHNLLLINKLIKMLLFQSNSFPTIAFFRTY